MIFIVGLFFLAFQSEAIICVAAIFRWSSPLLIYFLFKQQMIRKDCVLFSYSGRFYLSVPGSRFQPVIVSFVVVVLVFLIVCMTQNSGTVRKKNHIFVRVRWYLECLAHVEEERRVVQDAEESGIGAWWERTNRFKRKQHIITNRIFSANNNTNIYSMMMVAQLWV